VLPSENEKDLAEVPENLRREMKLHFVDSMDEVLQIALEQPLPSIPESSPIPAITPQPEGTEARQ
jgi:ATP-dependent Lon protease